MKAPFFAQSAVRGLDARLREAGDPQRAVSERAYLKSDLRFYGAVQAAIRGAARDFQRAHPDLTLGRLVLRNPRMVATMRRWARDDVFWIRRSALLSLLPELRAGRGDFALFDELASPMLEERELFIRKVIGWILRDRSKVKPAEVAAYVKRNRARMSGLTLREASKYL